MSSSFSRLPSAAQFLSKPADTGHHARAVSVKPAMRFFRHRLKILPFGKKGIYAHAGVGGHSKSRPRRLLMRLVFYFYKMRGTNPATANFSTADMMWTFFGAFTGMLVLALVNIGVWGRQDQGLLIGSLGASVMLVFGAPHAPFAQPRNVIGGQMISALVGVFVQHHLGAEPWLAAAVAVAFAITAMHITATLHPPGGATALIAVAGAPELKSFGYLYAVYPVGVSVIALVAVGVVINNFSRRRRYPMYWW